MSWVLGVDGCRGGWVGVAVDATSMHVTVDVMHDFAAVVARKADLTCVDIPIGLLDAAARGGRECDRAARALLRAPRASSVFSAPIRSVLGAATYPQACQLQRASSPARISLSKQAWAIVPKIREVDSALQICGQARVVEVHPELCFLEMNGRVAISAPKKTATGAKQRVALLQKHGLGAVTQHLHARRPTGADNNDVVDAFAAAWTALRRLRGQAVDFPNTPQQDGDGLRMEMWR